MKKLLLLFIAVFSIFTTAQNIQVDSQSFTPQQLIEDILIDNSCISNVNVTNVIGGNFNSADKSYGFFDATGTTFPFQSGVVLSTGRLSNVPGPNTSLSDDDAVNWIGDTDLETILNESNTINATILEFNFTALSNQVSFRYIFASEEYQENNANTCVFSDLFGFLIRPITSTQYENIALVPNTETPVKVTTVHPVIPDGCFPINEAYFESWNSDVSPINFNGQTKILTAVAETVTNQTYHVKLVIADDINFRYDSVVFLEANSFRLNTELGPNRLIATNNAICNNETLDLDATQQGSVFYKWFKDGIEITGETNSLYTVSDAGSYNVEVELTNNCISYGEVIVEYIADPISINSTLIQCDINEDGLTTYNLFNAETDVTNNDTSLSTTNFFINFSDAEQNINPIPNSTSFQNTTILEIIFARVENQSGCFSIAEITLDTSFNTLIIPTIFECNDDVNSGFEEFNLSEIRTTILNIAPPNSVVTFYATELDALANNMPLVGFYVNTQPFVPEIIYVKVIANNICFTIMPIALNIFESPQLSDNTELIYCSSELLNTVTIESGVLNNYFYQWFFNGTDTLVDTPSIDINEPGDYSVIVTHPNGCSTTRDITVQVSSIATIDDIVIVEASTNNSITVLTSGEGIYVYALNNSSGTYQDSNIFTNVAPGFHTVYVKDIKNDCGIVEQLVSVLGFPKYFTPNGDSTNDTWQIRGVNERLNQDFNIKIFDRFGKLLSTQNYLNNSWNGVYNGNNLPSDDYWFVISFADGRQYKNHFALVR